MAVYSSSSNNNNNNNISGSSNNDENKNDNNDNYQVEPQDEPLTEESRRQLYTAPGAAAASKVLRAVEVTRRAVKRSWDIGHHHAAADTSGHSHSRATYRLSKVQK